MNEKDTQMKAPAKILAADIGGTHSRFGHFEIENGLTMGDYLHNFLQGLSNALAGKSRCVLKLAIEELNEEHQKVIAVLREYYEKNGIAPMVRVLSKVTGFKLKHIYELFPSGPGKGACKMAGLPKPTGCV